LDYENTPVSEALSMGLHESQSLFWERNIFLSESFWKHYTTVLKQSFPQIPTNKTAKDLYAAVNIVTPNLIRIDADEVIYPMHIILRHVIYCFTSNMPSNYFC
jgi:carboxypeptidase Taq